MSLPDKSGYNDERLVQYLLGLLPSEDAERLDEASIADDDISARLRIVEDDLVDAYVRGTLIGETRTRFESHYLSSPRRRERVAMARTFVRTVDRAAGQGPVDVRQRPGGSRLVSTLAVAAALSLVASGALLLQNQRLGRGLSVAQNERVAIDQRARDLERQVSELRGANANAARELERARESTASVAREMPTIALVLMPQTRSIGPLPTLAVPPTAERLGFELRLESDDFPAYQVGLKDPAANTIVWRSGWVAAVASSGRPSVRVAVPATALKPQHYSLDLSGRRGAGQAEVVGSYAFQIVPR
jgi:hypothetical protein